MLYHSHSAAQVLRELDTSTKGLSSIEAEERLKRNGLNRITIKEQALWRKLVEPFRSIFMLILFIGVGITLYDHDMIDAIIIAIIILVSVIISYIQRFSTERMLRTLERKTASSVTVIRNNTHTTLSIQQLVPGDIIILAEGEKIPADIRLLQVHDLIVDESQLTGETEPIQKQTEPIDHDKEVNEQSNVLFQGSFIIGGEATGVIIRTGNDTEFGQLAAVAGTSPTESPVQEKIDILLRYVFAGVAALAVTAFILSLLRHMSLADSLKFVMALSVSAVPEILPVAISIILVVGIHRVAKKHTIIKTMRAIETIGLVSAIATDKTGTLTKNKLSIQELWKPRFSSHTLEHVLAHAVNRSSKKHYDPLDSALEAFLEENHHPLPHHAPLKALFFDPTISLSGNVRHEADHYRLSVKGAPEQILARSDLTEGEREEAEAELHHLSALGYKVIAVADIELEKPLTSFAELPARKRRFSFAGFVAVTDIVRGDAYHTIAAAHRAGISVRMITGDHFEAAFHIGKRLGIVTHPDQVFDAQRMSLLTDVELSRVIERCFVFSRVTSEHKYRLLSILKEHQITAMTGDGVNDVLSLTAAHVGIATGSSAQITKDASDIILLNDNFKGVIDAAREGRTVFANIRRMIFYLLATNAGEVLTMLGALLLNLPLPLLPVQILWVNLVTDTALVIPLGLEPGERINMLRPPRAQDTPILSKFMISRMILVALTMAGTTLLIYNYFLIHENITYARTMAFTCLVVMQWASALAARTDYESLFTHLKVMNWAFWSGLIVAVIFQILALFGPLQSFVHAGTVHTTSLIHVFLLSLLVPILLSEIHKWIGRSFFHKGKVPLQMKIPNPSQIG